MHIFLPWFAYVSVCLKSVPSWVEAVAAWPLNPPKAGTSTALLSMHNVTRDFLCNIDFGTSQAFYL